MTRGALAGTEQLASAHCRCYLLFLKQLRPVFFVERLVGVQTNGLVVGVLGLPVALEIIVDIAHAIVGVRVLWIEANGLLIGRDSILITFEIIERVALSIISTGVAGIEIDRLLVSCQRIGVTALVIENVAFAVIGAPQAERRAYKSRPYILESRPQVSL
jgi:hypothetical protein